MRQVNITVETHEMVDIGPLPNGESADGLDRKATDMLDGGSAV